MVFPIIVATVARVAPIIVSAVQRYYKYESKLFNKAYQGVPPAISYGVRHGYVAGSVIGSFFTPSMNGENESPDSKRKTRGKLVKPRSRRIKCYPNSNMQRSNTTKRFGGKRRRYWR